MIDHRFTKLRLILDFIFQDVRHGYKTKLVQPVWRRHGPLDDQAADVLPALLQQRHEVVDGEHDVGNELVLGHLDVSDRDTHAQNLLQLELDGRLDFADLGGQVVGVGDWRRELAGWPLLDRARSRREKYLWTDRDQGYEGSA